MYYTNNMTYLAEVYESQGKNDKAIEQYQKSLQIKEPLFG